MQSLGEQTNKHSDLFTYFLKGNNTMECIIK